MSRQLTPRSSIENLRKEAKRWLRALRSNDPDARARLDRAIPNAPADPGLRDVQFALAREYGFSGWTALTREVERLRDLSRSRDDAIHALLEAAERGDATRVRALLETHPDIVNERAALDGHSGRRTALHFAMNRMNEDVVDALLAHGADPNVRDDGDNAMPIHFAAERGNLAIVRRLIEHGADPIGSGDTHELEVIGWATGFEYAYHEDVAQYLLAHGARHNIFSAVAMGDTAAIREIAAHSRAEIDRVMDRTNHRRRPLHLAVLKRRPESLETLLELGADTEAVGAAGLTPLDQAALAGERAMTDTLIAHGAQVRFPAAVALGRTDDVERLLHSEPDALRPGGRWEHLIVRAAERSSGDVIDALVRAGAAVNVDDDSETAIDGTLGLTPLHAAAATGNISAIRALLRHGADPTARESKYWSTPAGWAAYFGHNDARDVILDADIDLFDAIAFDRPDRIRSILQRDPAALTRTLGECVPQYDAVPSWLDPSWTPAQYAEAIGKSDMVPLLDEES